MSHLLESRRHHTRDRKIPTQGDLIVPRVPLVTPMRHAFHGVQYGVGISAAVDSMGCFPSSVLGNVNGMDGNSVYSYQLKPAAASELTTSKKVAMHFSTDPSSLRQTVQGSMEWKPN